MQPTRATRWFPAFLFIVIVSMVVAIVVSAIVQSKLLNREVELHQVIAEAANSEADAQRGDAPERIRVEVVAVRPRSWVQALELWLLAPRREG
jgi:hypothetical protein